jgi:ATP-dependent DNA helicase RecG
MLKAAQSAPLQQPVSVLHGVGPAVQTKLQKMGIESIEDLLFQLPARYEDRRIIKKIAELREGEREIFCGEILAAGEETTRTTRRQLFEVIVSDGTGQILLKWFHYKKNWMKQRFAVGRKAFFIADVKRFGSLREAHHPDVEFIKENSTIDTNEAEKALSVGTILPLYHLTEGLHQKTAQKVWRDAVTRFADSLQTHIPEAIRNKRGLMTTAAAIQAVHNPAADSRIDLLESGRNPARLALVYDEFFFLALGMAMKRRGVVIAPGIPFKLDHQFTKPLAALLPYTLTKAQRRVLGEIKRDVMSPHPMNRLIQGDVGSGKTIVALMTALIAIENSCQVAIVAPTEILAEQHFAQFKLYLDQLGLKAILLSGSLKPSEKREVYARIELGEIDLVVGTHAVLQQGVTFHRLGLGIVDEQHRFGVKQRAVLRQKGEHPHLLVMTATPIPRTLALTLYGDLSLSVIDEMPPGRHPVQTSAVMENRRADVYNAIRQELKAGRQTYIVYPLVEESEKSDLKAATVAAEQLQSEFADYRVGLLHGRMTSEQKDAEMKAFKENQIHLLVSTTVIEVGIDVPNATIIVIEHAERFGLAQLHQLRGRVGRGEGKSRCFLIRSNQVSDDGLKRLQVMTETNDGFRIAEADLEIRGPGDFIGTRQAGLPDFRVANLLRDARILDEAHEDAFELANRPGFLTAPEYEDVRQELKQRWGGRLELVNAG